jgi:transcription elongation factor
MQLEVMEVIGERLVCLKTLIGQKKEGEERSIIDRLKEVMESAEKDESLYISLAAELSEQLEATKETIVILKREVTNTLIG